MTYLLDSNVISELWKPDRSDAVMGWLASSEWLIPAPVIAEIQEGAESSPSATRRLEVNRKLDSFLLRFGGFVVDWDAETSRTWGRLRHSPEVKRQPQALWDSLIDALAVRHGLTVATRNTGDFRHAETLNPWTFTA